MPNGSAAPSREQVLAALERVLASAGFVEAGRLGPFLRHLVSQALAGETNRLKESVLGVEVFRRPADYDPRIDPIIRVEARRLRSRLEEYYQRPGLPDPVRIELPKGTYIPVFLAGEVPAQPASRPRRLRPAWLAAALAGILLLAAGGWWLLRVPGRHVPSNPSLAVFPFVNLSQDPENEYFSDGLTEELIDAIARVEGFRVAARSLTFQYKGKPVDVRAVGRQLNVTSVLEGSVRRAGDRLRITVQLINVADGYQLWSHTYERREKDVFAVQEEIARAVVNALRLELRGPPGQLFEKRYTENLEVYNLYLKARFQANRFSAEGARKAIEYLEQALALDDRYAPAHALLATVHGLIGYYEFEPPAKAWGRAKEHARKAIDLDPSLSEARAALCFALGFHDWNWKECEAEGLRAIELNPASAEAHGYYAIACLLPAARLEEANRELRRALELDPLSVLGNYTYGFSLLAGGRYDAAVSQYQKTLELKPDQPDVWWDLGMALGYAGRHEEAGKYFRKSAELRGQGGVWGPGPLELFLTGKKEEARRVARSWMTDLAKWPESKMHMARHFATVGEKEIALRLLEESVRARESQALWIKLDPRLAPLRGDPRYEALVKKVGLWGLR
ncbi:MAG: tetratricopeptide repeat protein [Acidobacteriota bacterium]